MSTLIPLPEQVVRAVRAVTGPGAVALHEPRFRGNEWQYLKECLDTGYVSSVGTFVNQFEADLAVYTGARHAVAVVNGTAALQVALCLAGVQPNDEVLVPALTFVATASAVMHSRATPHFVDSDDVSLGVDPVRLRAYLRHATEKHSGLCYNRRTGRVVRALVPMHTFGHPAAIDGLLAVAHDFGLEIVEDAAESLGSTVGGRHTGTFGRMGALSFNGNKTITTGGGGAILTNDQELAKRAKHLTTTAKLPHKWEYVHDEVGFNYRMPNINAALGCAQLEQLPSMLQSKRALYEHYVQAFSDVSGARMLGEPPGCHSNFWLQTLVLESSQVSLRDAVLEATNAAGLMTRPAWRLLHQLAPYQGCPRMDLTVAESLERRLINLPSSAFLGGASSL
jgi:aminotransferase in exopolysaccharide biosynthesis